MLSIRQGDVLLKPIDKIQGKEIAKGEKILAYGEVTGHKHLLKGDAMFFLFNNQVLVDVGSKGAELIHEEHNNLQVPEGRYAVVLQRELDILQGIRQVLD